MIHVAMPALNSALVNLGMSCELIERVKQTIGMLTLDPTVCPFHSRLENQLLLLIENTVMYQQGVISIDEVVVEGRVLSRILNEVAARYTACNVPHRADLVLTLSRAIADSFKWA